MQDEELLKILKQLSGRRLPGVVGGGDAQCVLCQSGAAVSLGGVSAAQSGRQPDADESLRFSEPTWGLTARNCIRIQPVGLMPMASLGLPEKEQARQVVQPSDTASRLKLACHPGLVHATRSGRRQHVSNSLQLETHNTIYISIFKRDILYCSKSLIISCEAHTHYEQDS